MSQHDMVIDNGPGLAVRVDLQAALQALVSNNSGTVEPGTIYAGMSWLDTSAGGDGVLRIRDQANSSWLNFSAAFGGIDGLHSKGTALASASTTTLANATGDFVHITGTATINSFGAANAGTVRVLVFDGAATLVHNATSMILPGGANIQTAAGDSAIFVSEGSSNWRCVSYQRAEVQGSYTPTITAGANVQATSAYTCYYTRKGNQVHVWGLVDIDPTAASTNTTFYISLPIASNLASIGQLSGMALNRNNSPGGLYADTANDRAICDYISGPGTSVSTLSFAFDYVVV